MEEKGKPGAGRPYDLEERTFLRIKTCRKESKESAYWLRLLDAGGSAESESTRVRLLSEARELMNIFAAILRKSQ